MPDIELQSASPIPVPTVCDHDHEADHDHAIDWADRAGMWASMICLVHCALTPLFIALVPAVMWGGDQTHFILALILPVLALVAFVPGYRLHRDWTVLAMGTAGLVLIVSALTAPKPYVEIALTVTGSLLLIRAHWRNRILKRKYDKCPRTQVCD